VPEAAGLVPRGYGAQRHRDADMTIAQHPPAIWVSFGTSLEHLF
jgi:hypothetical protein